MKIKKETITAMWLFVVINMLSTGIISFMKPEFLKGIQNCHEGAPENISILLLAAIIMMEIPIAMVFLSRILKKESSRWLNIVAGIITILTIFLGGSKDPYYLFSGTIEVICLLFIIYSAWSKSITD